MQPDLRSAGERFVGELKLNPRRRVPLEQIRSAYAQVCPELAERADARRHLKTLILTAVEQGVCRLPRKVTSRDRQNEDGLPLFIVLNRPARASRVVIPPGYAWHPMLAFAVEERSARRLECLKTINEWLKRSPDLQTRIPIKERSLEIFGNEKKLDRLRSGGESLFQGRLALARLGCRICPLPLPFEMGPASAQGRPVLVLENHDTWFSFCDWNRENAQYACVAYAGGGHRKGLAYDEGFLDELLQRARSSELSYFGDVDPAGLSIAAGTARIRANRNAVALTPATTLYQWVIEHGFRRPMRSRQQSAVEDILWLPDPLRSPVEELFRAGLRIPQESLGTIALRRHFRF
jgi:hypothetical protein